MLSLPKAICWCCLIALCRLSSLGGDASHEELPPLKAGPDDWPCWRGPTLDGKAACNAPTKWSQTENIVWKADVPGRGHASPCVCGGRVFIATCDETAESQLLLGYDRKTGSLLWKTVVHEGGLEHRHEKNSHASATPACDGERVFMPFLNRGAIRVTATDLDGKILWQKDAGAFETMHGYSSSPVLWKSFVIVNGDSSAGSFLAALHRKTGEVVWKTPRRNVHSFATPALGVVCGKPQLVLNAAETVSSYDPDTGKPLWFCEGPAQIQACTLALGPDLVFASGGYPEKEIICLRGDGSGDVTQTHIAWRTKHGVTYVPSPLYHEGRFLVVNGGGVVTCFEGKTGVEVWKDRLPGEFSASPVLAGGLFYDTNEDGVTHVFKADGKLELVASNDLGDGGFATPAICGGQIFIRTSHHLYCIGAHESGAYVRATAYAIPKHTTSEGSGYFSIIEGKNGRLYIGTAKYRESAFLVEFDPSSKEMRVVVDAMAEIRRTFPDRPDGSATGFAAQAKFHTRNNVGASGKIYVATKQGYPKEGEKREDYRGGYPMVYDPATGTTRVYDIPVPHQGIISITPDESRGVAYISTCSDERPLDSSHFMILDLTTGKYRDLLDCHHMYAFIVIDHLGRVYHPILGGDIARYDPRTDKLDRLAQTIDGAPPKPETLLATPESHPINWDITPDRKTLCAVAMNGNQLFSYDLAADGTTIPGRSLGKLLQDVKGTDCRAMCVGPTGVVWAAVSGNTSDGQQVLHLVSYHVGDAAPRDHGAIAIANPKYTDFTDAEGKPLPFHHGIRTLPDGTAIPLYHMGVCAARDGTVYVTVIDPYTLLEIRP